VNYAQRAILSESPCSDFLHVYINLGMVLQCTKVSSFSEQLEAYCVAPPATSKGALCVPVTLLGTLPAIPWLRTPAFVCLRHIQPCFKTILRLPPPGGNPNMQLQRCWSPQCVFHIQLPLIWWQEGAQGLGAVSSVWG